MIQKKENTSNRSYIGEDFVDERERGAGPKGEAAGVRRLGFASCTWLFFKYINLTEKI